MFLRYLFLYLFSLVPVVEGRYALGYAVSKGLDPAISLLVVCLGTSTLAIALSLAFPKIDSIFSRSKGKIGELYARVIKRLREKVRPYVEKYGALGLTIFVAVPLPVTGVWTGGIAAYLLGLGRKALIPLLLGGLISNLISFAVLHPFWAVS